MTRLAAKTLLIGLVLGLVVSPLVSAHAAAKAGDKVQIAQRILDYRKENGAFKRVEDILKVRGVGEKMFEQLKDQITVGETTNK
jgi:competence ComEA-like helix-hairpin-helix protein